MSRRVSRSHVIDASAEDIFAVIASPAGHEKIDGSGSVRGTRVTETFDWSTAISPWVIERMGWPDRHPANLESTLERLEAVVLAGP